jgi:hypothetical protein
MNLRDALEDVYGRRGKLTPQLVVDEARGQRTTAGRFLHPHFEWDDAVAAEHYRYSQAQDMIQRVQIRYRKATSDESLSVRAFYAVQHPEKGNVYEPLAAVVEDPMLKELVRADFERDWKTFKRRWEHLDYFLELISRDVLEAVA